MTYISLVQLATFELFEMMNKSCISRALRPVSLPSPLFSYKKTTEEK